MHVCAHIHACAYARIYVPIQTTCKSPEKGLYGNLPKILQVIGKNTLAHVNACFYVFVCVYASTYICKFLVTHQKWVGSNFST